MDQELKKSIEDSNKLIETLRSEVASTKSNSAESDQKVARIEGELATALQAKSAIEARLTAVETAAARPGSMKATDVAADEYKEAFVAYLRRPNDYERKSRVQALEAKSVNTVTAADGGLAVPKQMALDILTIAKDFGAVRRLATVVSVGTPDYVQMVSIGGAGYEWLGELDTHNVTDAPKIREVRPAFGEIAARVQVTNHALEDMFFDVEDWVKRELAETFAQAEARAFIDGNGVKKPLGLLNSTTIPVIKSGVADGLGTDVFGNMINLMFGVNGAYRTNGAFLMNSATLARLIKVKNTAGDYIYQQSLAAAMPSTILGYRVETDENMPDVGAGTKPIVFGDFRAGYLIADRIGFSTLVNPYKISGIVEIEARKRVGGVVKLPEALRVLHLAV